MAQLNDLLVMGQSTLLGPVNIKGKLTAPSAKINDLVEAGEVMTEMLAFRGASAPFFFADDDTFYCQIVNENTLTSENVMTINPKTKIINAEDCEITAKKFIGDGSGLENVSAVEVLTETEFDALTSYTPNTLYCIID